MNDESCSTKSCGILIIAQPNKCSVEKKSVILKMK